MQYIKPITIVSLHAAAPLFAGWSVALWYQGHQLLTLLIGACASVVTIALWVRDCYLDEIAEALSPTTRWHGSTAIEPPRPLPAFPAEENPSRIRIKPLLERGPYASVAPEDAEAEDTLPSSKEAS